MRVLTVEPGPAFSVTDVHRGWAKALRNLGCETVNINFADRLDFYAAAKLEKNGQFEQAMSPEAAILAASKGIEVVAFEWWPDGVFITSCFFVPMFTLDVLRDRGMKVVLLLTESPYEDGRQLDRAAHADLVLLNDPTNLERFREINPNTHYTPHSYDPDIHRLRAAEPELASDVCFVGTGYPSRIHFFEQIDWTDLDLVLAGNWQALKEESPLRSTVAHPIDECIDNEQAQRLYASTRASLNLYRRESEDGQTADGWAMGPREVELAASGTFYVTEARGENRDVLPMIPTFDGPDDCEAQLRWYLSHDETRSDIALKAREAISDRTFENAAARALSLV